MVAPASAVPGWATRRRLALPHLGPARTALLLYALLVAAAGIATARAVAVGAPQSGLLVTGSGHVLLLDPGGAAAQAGVRGGDTVTAVNGVPVSGLNLWRAQGGAAGGPIWLTEGAPGHYLLFAVRPGVPGATQVAADVAVLVVALLLWLSGLVVGLPRRRDRPARLYALAALSLALALCAVVARDGDSLWSWLLLAPAALTGLAALLLANLDLAGALSRRVVAAVAALAALPAILAIVGFAVALPAVTALVAVALGMLAAAAMLVPLVAHVFAPAEPRRRTLRITLLGGVAGLLPVALWPGLTVALALTGHTGAEGADGSPLWCALALVPLATLYTLLFLGRDARRLDENARAGASYVAAAGLLAALVLAVAPALPQGGRVALVAVAAILFPLLQRGVERALARAVRGGVADYAAALRVVENASAEATTPAELAMAGARRLPALLLTRSVAVLLRGLDCPPDAYRLVDAAGCSDVVLQPEPDLIAHSLAEARPIAAGALPDGAAAASLRRLGAALWAPLWWDNAQRGALCLGPRLDGDEYQRDDVEGIVGLTGLLALSFHTQELVAHLRERTDALVALNHRLSEAHEQERAHLSRELHDVVAQELIALTRQLRRYGDGATPPPAIWADMLAAAQDALTATRRICNGLRPAILDLGLAPALRDLVAAASEREGAPEVSLSIEGDEQRLAGELEFALFRVAQEGLNNALSHSGARQIRVEALFNGGVRLRVRDDGRGFRVPRRFEDLPGDHLGLIGMRERLAQLGGALTIASEPGRGTVLEASAAAPATPSSGRQPGVEANGPRVSAGHTAEW